MNESANANEEQPDVKRDYDRLGWLLGALFALPSLISTVQRELEVGLAPAFDGALSFYRSIVADIVGALNMRDWPYIRSLTFEQLGELLDTVVVSALIASILARILAPMFGKNWWAYPLSFAFLAFLQGGTIRNSIRESTVLETLVITWTSMLAIVVVLQVMAGFNMFAGTNYVALGELFRSDRKIGGPTLLVLRTTAIWIAGLVAFYVGNLMAKGTSP